MTLLLAFLFFRGCAAWVTRQAAAGQAPTSPLTNQPLSSPAKMRPNYMARTLVEKLRKRSTLF